MRHRLSEKIAQSGIKNKGDVILSVEVHLFSQSKPIVYEEVLNAYTKDGMFCVLLKEKNSVHKYPMCNIFRVTESYNVCETKEFPSASDQQSIRKELKDGTIEYRLPNGQFHREDGPAIEHADGSKAWYLNGKLHRDDGPAVEWANGYKEWCLNGKLHRDGGPAIERADGSKEWHQNGNFIKKESPTND